MLSVEGNSYLLQEQALKAQQHGYKLDRELAAKKAEHASEVQSLKQEGGDWEGKWLEESKKVQAVDEQLQRQEERMQALLSEKDKAFRDVQDAVKVVNTLMQNGSLKQYW